MSRRVLLAFSCILVIGGCGEESLAPEDVAGTYALQSVDGQQVPLVLIETGTTYLLEITGGSLVLNLNTTCTTAIVIRETVDGVATTETQTAFCTYIPSGGGLELAFPTSASLIDAMVVGSTITYIESGSTYVFQK